MVFALRRSGRKARKPGSAAQKTRARWRRRGVAAELLAYIIGEAKARGYRRLSLGTGSQVEFAPARAMYARRGFVECGPFGDYKLDPNSVFMTLGLG